MFQQLKKSIAYHLSASDDATQAKYLNEFFTAMEQHQEELDNVWDKISYEKKGSLANIFRFELTKEWLTEASEIQRKEVIQGCGQLIIKGIHTAFLSGYMMGKGWISKEQVSALNLQVGDKLATEIRQNLKKSKSRGLAFSSAFACVAVEGHLHAISDRL